MPGSALTAGRLSGQRANAGPTGATWEVWATLGGLEPFGVWVKAGAICRLLPVIFRVTGLSASQHSVCDTRAAGGAVVWVDAPQRRPTLEWVALESEPWSSMTSGEREALDPPSRLYHLPAMEAARAFPSLQPGGQERRTLSQPGQGQG